MRAVRFAVLLLLIGLLGTSGGLPSRAQMAIPPNSLQEVIERAQTQQTPILVEIYAPWCPYCERMQNTVYADSTVRNYLDAHFTYVRLNQDTTGGRHQFQNQTLSTRELASALGARGVPTTVFLKADGTPIARQPGFVKRPAFLTMIRYVGSGAYRNQSFQEFQRSSSR